jgi:hypothetical protein
MCEKTCGNTLPCTDATMTGVQNPRKLGQDSKKKFAAFNIAYACPYLSKTIIG